MGNAQPVMDSPGRSLRTERAYRDAANRLTANQAKVLVVLRDQVLEYLYLR